MKCLFASRKAAAGSYAHALRVSHICGRPQDPPDLRELGELIRRPQLSPALKHCGQNRHEKRLTLLSLAMRPGALLPLQYAGVRRLDFTDPWACLERKLHLTSATTLWRPIPAGERAAVLQMMIRGVPPKTGGPPDVSQLRREWRGHGSNS
jgi:hypothetical protein